MAKINQIQKTIEELDGGAFQKLADSYLLKKGCQQINPIGSVSGNNKVRKGTPDTLIPTQNGKYIFAEYTTTFGNREFKKFCDDIDKCFDENKTGIPVSKIEEIILCYTSELSPDKIEQLRDKCQGNSVNLNIYSIGSISFDLLEKYPSIAKDYLGIDVNTGQIVPLDRFVSLYEKNKLTTTLKTVFHFREDEKSNLLTSIEHNNLVIISGQAGVGKSRIAVECYQQFIKLNKSYKAYCIFNQGIDLFEDIKSYFSDSGDYLIFVDDANRVNGFQYILQLLQTQRNDQNFKIIVTVRDYALDKIKESCKPFGLGTELNLSPFTDDEIKKLVQDEFKINNHHYLERIIDIAQGNPRLAIMAAKVAKENNTLESINDVSELYETYYSSIKTDLNGLNDGNILKVAGIMAFFRSLDKTNYDLMLNINKIFNISPEDFWEAAKTLHDMEVLDMFENEVIKTSDQVLATYLFYLVFFKEKTFDFSILITNLFPRFKQRLIDAINPIISSFDYDETKKVLQSSVDNVWGEIQENNEADFLQLIDVFWFLKPTETLLYIKNKIECLNAHKISIDDVKFEADSSSTLTDFLSTLSLFRFSGATEITMSLDIFMQYLNKQPQETAKVLRCFADSYGFQPDSYRFGYHVQFAVIEKIIEYCESGENEYFSRFLIALSEKYLHTHYSVTEPMKGQTVTIVQFDLADTVELSDLRKLVWTNLFSLYKNKNLQQDILHIFFTHSLSGLDLSVTSIIQQDAMLVTTFFNNNLDSENLYHCIIVQQYLKLLKRLQIPFDHTLKKHFRSTSYEFYEFLTDRLERMELKLSHEDYREYQKKKIAKLTQSYLVKDYSRIFQELFHIRQLLGSHTQWQINQGAISIFEELSERNSNLYIEVVEDYLQKGEILNLNAWSLVSKLMESSGTATALKIVSIAGYPAKNRWLFHYYQNLSESDIEPKHINALINLYTTSKPEYFNNDLDFLLKYESIEKGFIAKVIKIIVDRANSDHFLAHSLSLIFNKNTDINKHLPTLLPPGSTLLEDAYISVDKIDSHADYNGFTFSKLLDNNQNFINRYLDDKFARKRYLSKHDDSRDYSFIWLREDYIDIINSTLGTVFKYEQKGQCFEYYESFFNKNVNPQTDENILARQDAFLCEEVRHNSNEIEYMRFLFSVITGFKPERKIKYYEFFLKTNQFFGDFKKLPFEPRISSWSGSRVPQLQEKIDFNEKVISLCNSVDLLQHRLFVEQKITSLRQEIQHEKKRDFTEEY